MTQTDRIIDANIAINGLRINRELDRLHRRRELIEQIQKALPKMPASRLDLYDEYDLFQFLKTLTP